MAPLNSRWLSLTLTLALAAALTAGAHAATVGTGATPPNTIPPTGAKPTPRSVAVDVKYEEKTSCDIAGPEEVVGYHVVCAGASYLDFTVADCCIPGDHWQLKGKAWDGNPNTAVTTSPGGQDVLGVPARIYNYGGTATNPGGLDAYVECSYLSGVNSFGASSTVIFSSDGVCTMTPDPIVRRIDRTP